MKEQNVQAEIMLATGRGAQTRVFRNNTGLGWTGQKVLQVKKGMMFIPCDAVIILNPRPLHAGLCKGSSDLIGWHSVNITPEMIGRKIAAFVGFEVKPTAKIGPSPYQQNFINQVNQSGGISGVVHSPEMALDLLARFRGA